MDPEDISSAIDEFYAGISDIPAFRGDPDVPGFMETGLQILRLQNPGSGGPVRLQNPPPGSDGWDRNIYADSYFNNSPYVRVMEADGSPMRDALTGRLLLTDTRGDSVDVPGASILELWAGEMRALSNKEMSEGLSPREEELLRAYQEYFTGRTGFQDGGMVGPDIPQEWLDAVGEAADLYGLPEEVLTALITQESNWDPSAVSPKGAVGLTQVLPATAAEMLPGYSKQGIATLLQDPIHQISLGARHLSGLRDRLEGSLPEALAVYNSGAGTRDAPRVRYFDEAGERRRVFDTAETQNYLLDIMDRARGDESEMYTRRRSEDRTPEERRALIEERFYAVPGARYDYEGDSYTPIRPMMRPDPGF